MWSVLQAMHGCCERAVKGAVIPGSGLDWAQHYHGQVESDRFCLNEWGAMNDLESVRRDSSGQSSSDRLSKENLIKEQLRDIMRTEDLEKLTSKEVHSALTASIGFDMKPYKEYIDNEMMVVMAQMDKPSKIFDYLYLGSEWNAANFEELQKNNVGYILNVTREIDNFFPESFTYTNIRVYDVEATDLLPHWTDTYKFINDARKTGQSVLVHCKMGVSRSASTVIAYAMKQQHWSLEVALSYVSDRRPIIKPNAGFMKQLQTYSGILNASQQRHSKLWRRKSREKKMSLRTNTNEGGEGEEEEEGSEGEEEEEENEEELEELDEEEDSVESPDEVDNGGGDEEDPPVFEDPAPESGADEEAPPTAPLPVNPVITVEGETAQSLNRSRRMNLFSLMLSISELDDDEKLPGQLPGSPRRSPARSPAQPRRSHGRRGLVHQKSCVDVSPGPRKQEEAGLGQPDCSKGDGKTME